VRRFSSKEERRRIVATVYDPDDVPGKKVGFENHLNVFHCGREGLTPAVARGLAVYLNSTFVDVCFRQFNGHTQVNVKDLYNLRYPTLATLETLGKRVIGRIFPTQEEIDTWIQEEVF
jgi:adenine-specific DNA-methyltransferase